MSSSVKLFGNALSTYKSASKTNEDRLKFYDSFLKSVKGLSTIPHNANNYDDPPIEIPTASTENTSDNGMSAVLKVVEEFGKPDYTPFTGGGFADFLKQYGNENARAYSEGVREANSAFYRSLMNYGKNAEMLGANGLSSSGVSDYGNAAAYAARQGAVTELGKARLEADTDAMGEYTGRISAANAEGKAQAQAMANAKVQGLLSAIQSDIFDEASARIFAQQAGVYDEAEIDKFVGALSAYGKSLQDKQTVANGETLFANTQALFDNFISNGLSAEQARAKVEQYAQQMPSAYNAELIESIYNTHVNVQNMGKSDDPNIAPDETVTAATEEYNNLINQGVTPKAAADIINKNHGFDLGTTLMGNTNATFESIVKNGIDTMLNNGYSPFSGENQYSVSKIKQAINTGEISEAAGNAQIEKIQNANLEWVNNMLGKANDKAKVSTALVELGIASSSVSGDDVVTKIQIATDRVLSNVEALVASGEISQESAKNFYSDYFDMNFDTNMELMDKLKALSTFKEDVAYLEENEEVYGDAVEKVANGAKVKFTRGQDYDRTIHHMTVSLPNNKKTYKVSFDYTSADEFKGLEALGSFKQGDTTIVLYENNKFMVHDTFLTENVKYCRGIETRSDDIGDVMQDVFYHWLETMCKTK